MGMNTHVIGIKPPDEHYKKMLAAYQACEAAGVEPPQEVSDFFNDEPPEPTGVVVGLSESTRRGATGHHPCCRKWRSDSEEGFEIEIDKLPPDIKVIRFCNSW